MMTLRLKLTENGLRLIDKACTNCGKSFVYASKSGICCRADCAVAKAKAEKS